MTGLLPLRAPPEVQPPTLVHRLDGARIATLLEAVAAVMRRGAWRTLAEIQAECNAMGVHGSEAGISARLRDLRKPACGELKVSRRRRGEPTAGLWEYRLEVV